jgi:ankyrin repeat protein
LTIEKYIFASLTVAATHGNYAAVVRLLQAGAHVEPWAEFSALHNASFGGYVNIVKALLSRGRIKKNTLRAKRIDGRTAYQLAGEHSNKRTCKTIRKLLLNASVSEK